MSRSAAGVSLVVQVTLLCLSVGVNPSTATAIQDVFQAEEGSNVTLTCLFHLKTHTPATSLYIDIICENLGKSIYRYDSEYEPELYEDELYRGRVLCDLELLKKGRIECLFTDLRLNDTSTYIFIAVINRVSHSDKCSLKVTEPNSVKTWTTETPPHPTRDVQTPGSNETDVKDKPHVIGSPQPITAAVGDDVILPCHLEPKFNVQGLTVEWSKPDLKPNPSDRLSRVEYVHLYGDRREVPDMKIRSYFRRTALFTDDLRDGNISLKIMNVTLADEGRYRCFIPKLKSHVKDSIVRLVVEPNSVKTWTTETPPHPTRDVQTPGSDETDVKGGRLRLIVLVPVLVLVLLILGGGVAGYLLKHKCQKQNRPEYDVAPTEPLPV